MSEALIILEKYKVVHGDIKLGNIFMSSDGSFKLGILW
jgi:aminoglycoside phosphotransferase (APT) family kinase protein